jgi:hypothetical protein
MSGSRTAATAIPRGSVRLGCRTPPVINQVIEALVFLDERAEPPCPVAGPAWQQPGSIGAVPPNGHSGAGPAAVVLQRRLQIGREVSMFGSLDFIYVPTTDVDADAQRHVDMLGAQLVWKVRGMGTSVACLRVGEPGPAILLSGHLHGTSPILVYRVEDYAATVRQLRERGLTLHELEIPHGPCASFTAGGGQRYAVYQLVRPEAIRFFEGRIDP